MSSAVTSSTFWPRRSVTGTFSRTTGRGGASSSRATSTAFSVTTTRRTPAPLDTRPVTWIRGSVTRTRFAGVSSVTRSGAGASRSSATTSKFSGLSSRLSAFTICPSSGAYQSRSA